MNVTLRSLSMRAASALPAFILVAAACYQPPTTASGTDASSANALTTSVPLADANATGGNVPVDDPNAASGGNVASTTGGNATAVGLTISPVEAADLCLTSQSNPAAAGDAVALRTCAGGADQLWNADGGRLRIGGRLCLINAGAKVALAANATTGDPNLAPRLATCDANTNLSQHVTLLFGTLAVNDGASVWGLSYPGTPSSAVKLAWVQNNANAASQQWVAGRNAHDANGSLTQGGFTLTANGNDSTCLDANVAPPLRTGTTAGYAACDANAPTQHWRWVRGGQLQNGAVCLDANVGGTLGMTACDPNVASKRWGDIGGYGTLGADSGACLAGPSGSYSGPLTTTNCGGPNTLLFSWGHAP